MTEATQSQRLSWLRPRWAQPAHPIYQREMEGWAHSRGLRSLRVWTAPLAFLVFAGTGCLCGLTTTDPSASPQERLLIWSLIILLSLLVGQGFINFATGLIATALTATVVSGEIESETYGLLRVTGVPTNEIVLAKYAAALRQLVAPLGVIIGARFLIVLGAAATLDLALRMQGVDGGLFGLLHDVPLEAISPASAGVFVLAGLSWLGFFAFQPALSIMMHASAGLFASSIARTRVNGIITAIGLRVVLAVVRFMAEQVLVVGGQLSIGRVVSLGNMGLWLETLVITRPAWVVTVGSLLALGSLLMAILWRSAVTYLLVRGAVRRAYKLPYE